MNTLSPLTELKGIGEKTEKLFAKVGVTNVGELLSYYPRTYETYGEIQKPDAVTDGMTAALYGQFQGPLAVKRVKNMQIVSGVFESDAQKIRITWYNMPYLRSTVRAGVPYVLWGKAAKKNRRKEYMTRSPILKYFAFLFIPLPIFYWKYQFVLPYILLFQFHF